METNALCCISQNSCPLPDCEVAQRQKVSIGTGNAALAEPLEPQIPDGARVHIACSKVAMILQTIFGRLMQRSIAASQARMRMCGIALAAIALVSFCDATRAQDQRPLPTAASGLGQENMSLVAASPAEIKTVLSEDVGLMVELKRWAAKDATDHGQIIGEADLTDDAILNRIETDVPFRSIATQLLQRYGYLAPKVNPDSAARSKSCSFRSARNGSPRRKKRRGRRSVKGRIKTCNGPARAHKQTDRVVQGGSNKPVRPGRRMNRVLDRANKGQGKGAHPWARRGYHLRR